MKTHFINMEPALYDHEKKYKDGYPKHTTCGERPKLSMQLAWPFGHLEIYLVFGILRVN